MRMMADRYAQPKPATVKRQPSKIQHISAPLKGLNLSSKLTTGDPLTAPILTNFVVEDDRISSRAGYRKLSTTAGSNASVETLVPYYGAGGQKLAAASANKLFLAATGELLIDGFTGNDWSWTSFSNLGEADYTVMVNGRDGVWSWNGGTSQPEANTPVVSMTVANPAVATVLPADIGKFADGDTIRISGATGSWEFINGDHKITDVDTVANTFEVVGLDTTPASGGFPAGVLIRVYNSVAPEIIAVPVANPWITPATFNIVLSHMNRLWFADTANLAVYYLPVQQKGTINPDDLHVLPLNALFKRGGTIRAMYSWTVEGGIGTNDQLCIFSSNGECVMYSGTDPDSPATWELVGIFRFDAPMSKHGVINFGGDLYVLISTGLVPMSTLLAAESEQLGQVDKSVISLFLAEATKYRDRAGWQVLINPSSNRAICNVPQGHTNGYIQMVRHMPRPVWSQWQDIPSRCWGWVDPYLYFGDDVGNVYQMHPDFLNDNGAPIRIDVQPAWSQFRTPAIKHFKMLRTYMITDAALKSVVALKVDYDLTPPDIEPDVTISTLGATWDLATWDVDYWASGPLPFAQWNGVSSLGRVGAPRLTALLLNCTFSITGWDVLYEPGAAI